MTTHFMDTYEFITRFREVLIPLAQEIDGITWADRCRWEYPGVRCRTCWVVPRIYTSALIVGLPFSGCYDDTWCYMTPEAAVEAMNGWDGEGEPEGWHRHNSSGRRRPDGDPAKEYVRP